MSREWINFNDAEPPDGFVIVEYTEKEKPEIVYRAIIEFLYGVSIDDTCEIQMKQWKLLPEEVYQELYPAL